MVLGREERARHAPGRTPGRHDAYRLLPATRIARLRDVLDDAARRSVERRRANTLEYPEASEEVGFKGTMTLVGCGVLWVIVVLLFLSVWFPKLGWVIMPVLGAFLVLQVFLLAARRNPAPPAEGKRGE